MTEVSLEELIKLAGNADKIGSSATSISEVLESADKFLKQGDQIVAFIEKLEQRPSVSMFIRAYADKQKLSVEPLSKPAGSSSEKIVEVGIKPASETHEAMYRELNNISEADLKKMLEAQKQQSKGSAESILDRKI